MCSVSSGFKRLLTPITDGTTIDEIANTKPIFTAIKYDAEHDKNCGKTSKLSKKDIFFEFQTFKLPAVKGAEKC